MYKKIVYCIFLFLACSPIVFAQNHQKFPATPIQKTPLKDEIKIILTKNENPIEKMEKTIPLTDGVVLDNLRKRIFIGGTAEICTYQYLDIPDAIKIVDSSKKNSSSKIPYEDCHLKLQIKKMPHGMIFTIVKVEEKKIDFIFEKLNLINLKDKYPTNTEKFIYIGQILEKDNMFQKEIILPHNEKVLIQIGKNIIHERNIN